MLISIPYFFLDDNQDKKKHLVIFQLLILTVLVELIGKYMGVNKQNNSLIYNVGYVIIGLSLIFYFFSLVFHEKNVKRWVFFLWVLFICWEVINVLYFQSIFNVFHHYTLAFGGSIIIGLCFYYFFGIFYKNWYSEKSLLAVPEFWIISFLMFFYSASLLYFLSFNFFFEKMDIELFIKLNFLIQILGATMYFIMGLAFYAPLIFKGKNEINIS